MCFRRWFAVVLMLGIAPSAWGQSSRIIGDPARDVWQTMQARKLLADDPDLADWNIGVIVTDRVAVLWGPVPSVEAAFRAEICLKAMIELVEIRNELMIHEALEPMRAPVKIEASPRVQPKLLPPRVPEEVRPVWGAPGLLTGQEKTQSKPASAQTMSARIMPIDIKTLPKEEEARELTAAVRTFLQSKSAYAPVQFAVQDRSVFLKAASQDSDVLLEAARAIARLPNVTGVVLVDNLSPR